jgi:hypothetical protein
VFIPEQASWLSDFIDELTSFPAAPHDDMVDATTQALAWMRGNSNRNYTDYIGIGRGSTAPRSDTRGAVPEGSSRYPRPDLDAEIADDAAQSSRSVRAWGMGRRRFGPGTW